MLSKTYKFRVGVTTTMVLLSFELRLLPLLFLLRLPNFTPDAVPVVVIHGGLGGAGGGGCTVTLSILFVQRIFEINCLLLRNQLPLHHDRGHPVRRRARHRLRFLQRLERWIFDLE